MRIGIVGAEAAKFTPLMQSLARKIIRDILAKHSKPVPGVYAQSPGYVVSGGCHLGGIDIWAVEEGKAAGWGIIEHLPVTRTWPGFKARNEKIAQDSDELHVIVVRGYHKDYAGMRFPSCYHCHTQSHIKSGGCWTGHFAKRLGVRVVWHLIEVLE